MEDNQENSTDEESAMGDLPDYADEVQDLVPLDVDEGSEHSYTSGELEDFDISLPATHSYMGLDLPRVRARGVVSPGWRGMLPTYARPQLLFIGETLPLRLPADHAHELFKQDHMFALLFPDESSIHLSGYGVLCEAYECADEEQAVVLVKARATHRLRAPNTHRMRLFERPRMLLVEVLGESPSTDWLQAVRLPSLRAARHGKWAALARRMDAALTNVPAFLFDAIDYDRLKNEVTKHFSSLGMESLPLEPLSLSVWCARHGALAARDRLSLWTAGGALPRLWLSAKLFRSSSQVSLCCSACGTTIARQHHLFAMSSEGAHSHYANPGGYTHDIVTVRVAPGMTATGTPSAEYSWFPGYQWTVGVCTRCRTHLGWRFDAKKTSLRPLRFFGLCRNYVTPLEQRPNTPEL